MSGMIFCRLLFICALTYSVIWPVSSQQCNSVYEIPVECKDFCQTCQYRNGGCAQPAVCIPGCDCIQGFYRNEQGQCIPGELCPGGAIPPDCFQDADSGPCYGNFERFYFNKYTGRCETFIYGGCEGNTNNFLSKEECEVTCKVIWPGPPLQCPVNEIPVECIDQCQTCQYRNGGCAQPAVCIPGCNCIPGYFRNEVGQCIPAALCPASATPPECLQDMCQGPCTNYTERFYYNKHIGECAVFIYGGCGGNSNNFLSKAECEVKCKGKCGPNSTPSDCASPCPPTCPRIGEEAQGCAAVCVIGCVCNPGFINDGYGNCIPKDQCPGINNVCGPNSHWCSCASRCPPTCRIRNPYCSADCVEGCVCNPGYINDDFGNCIPEHLCPNPGPWPGPAQQCPEFEYPVPCIDRCQTCEYKNGHCAQIGVCTPGCNCVPGWLRDGTGKCIQASRCP